MSFYGLWLGQDVRVMHIDEKMHTISIILFTQHSMSELQSLNVRDVINKRVPHIIKYMVDEGFLSDATDKWNVLMDVRPKERKHDL